MFERIIKRFNNVKPSVDFWSLRMVHTRQEHIQVRQDILEPVSYGDDTGVMVMS